jgi:hypothetical protein
VFLTLMIVGLAGLFAMAVPAFARHGHAHAVHGPARGGHGAPLARGAVRAQPLGVGRTAGTVARGAANTGRSEIIAAAPTSARFLRLLPSPRAVCSVLALYGAFGNALLHAAHFPFALAATLALAPAILVEWALVRPVWNLVFRFQGQPSSPLDALILAEATAVVPFRNGRGVVSVVRDGRLVQLAARLCDAQAAWPVKVGDRLQIEEVDAERERVTVAVSSVADSPPR